MEKNFAVILDDDDDDDVTVSDRELLSPKGRNQTTECHLCFHLET